MWFEREESLPEDVSRCISSVLPAHFTATSKRGAYVGHMYPSTTKSFWYITSNIVGDFRGYKCRTVYHNHQVGNVFGSGTTLEDAVKKFVIAYTEWVK